MKYIVASAICFILWIKGLNFYLICVRFYIAVNRIKRDKTLGQESEFLLLT